MAYTDEDLLAQEREIAELERQIGESFDNPSWLDVAESIPSRIMPLVAETGGQGANWLGDLTANAGSAIGWDALTSAGQSVADWGEETARLGNMADTTIKRNYNLDDISPFSPFKSMVANVGPEIAKYAPLGPLAPAAMGAEAAIQSRYAAKKAGRGELGASAEGLGKGAIAYLGGHALSPFLKGTGKALGFIPTQITQKTGALPRAANAGWDVLMGGTTGAALPYVVTPANALVDFATGDDMTDVPLVPTKEQVGESTLMGGVFGGIGAATRPSRPLETTFPKTPEQKALDILRRRQEDGEIQPSPEEVPPQPATYEEYIRMRGEQEAMTDIGNDPYTYQPNPNATDAAYAEYMASRSGEGSELSYATEKVQQAKAVAAQAATQAAAPKRAKKNNAIAEESGTLPKAVTTKVQQTIEMKNPEPSAVKAETSEKTSLPEDIIAELYEKFTHEQLTGKYKDGSAYRPTLSEEAPLAEARRQLAEAMAAGKFGSGNKKSPPPPPAAAAAAVRKPVVAEDVVVGPKKQPTFIIKNEKFETGEKKPMWFAIYDKAGKVVGRTRKYEEAKALVAEKEGAAPAEEAPKQEIRGTEKSVGRPSKGRGVKFDPLSGQYLARVGEEVVGNAGTRQEAVEIQQRYRRETPTGTLEEYLASRPEAAKAQAFAEEILKMPEGKAKEEAKQKLGDYAMKWQTEAAREHMAANPHEYGAFPDDAFADIPSEANTYRVLPDEIGPQTAPLTDLDIATRPQLPEWDILPDGTRIKAGPSPERISPQSVHDLSRAVMQQRAAREAISAERAETQKAWQRRMELSARAARKQGYTSQNLKRALAKPELTDIPVGDFILREKTIGGAKWYFAIDQNNVALYGSPHRPTVMTKAINGERAAIDPHLLVPLRIEDMVTRLHDVITGGEKIDHPLQESQKFFQGSRYGKLSSLVSAFRKHFINARTVTQHFPKTKPILDAGNRALEEKQSMIYDAYKTMEPYYDLPESSKVVIDEALATARITAYHARKAGYEHKPITDRELVENFNLTDAERMGYFSVRKALDNSLISLGEAIKLKARKMPEEQRVEYEAAVDDWVSELLKHEYVPFSRFGQNWDVTVKDGAFVKERYFFDKKFEADRKKRELLAEGKVAEIAEREKLDIEGFDKLPPDLARMVKEFNPEAWTNMARERPVFGFGKHLIKAEMIPGFDPNIGRAASDYLVANAHYVSRAKAQPVFEETLATLDPKSENGLRTFWMEYVKDFNTPKKGWEGRADAFIDGMFLAGVPSSGLVNLTQMATTTYWKLVAKLNNNPVKAMNTWASALDDTWRLLTPGESKKVPESVMKYYRDFLRKGDLEANAVQEMHQRAKGLRRKKSPLEYMMLTFTFPEKITRVHAMASAVRLGMKQPKLVEEMGGMEAFVKDFIDETQFNQTDANRPAIARSGIGRLALRYKLFGGNYQRFLRNLAGESKPAFAGAVATMLALAGAVGIPGVRTARHVAEALDFDPELWLRENLGDNRKVKATTKGLPAALWNQDLSTSIGQSDLIEGFDTGPFQAAGKAIAGPLGTVAQNLWDAGEVYLDTRNPIKALEKAAPRMFKGPMRELEILTTGNLTNSHGDIVLPNPTPWEQIMITLGFPPERLTNKYQMDRSRYKAEKRMRNNHNLAERWANAQLDRGWETPEDVDKWIEEHNATSPSHERVGIDRYAARDALRKKIDPDAAAIRRAPRKGRDEVRRIMEKYQD